MPRVVDVSGSDHNAVLSQCGGSTIQLGAGADFQNLDSRGRFFFRPAETPEIHVRPLERSNIHPVEGGARSQSRPLGVDEATYWESADHVAGSLPQLNLELLVKV